MKFCLWKFSRGQQKTSHAYWIPGMLAGISGDMLLGALVDAGVSIELLRQSVGALNIGAELDVDHVDRSGIRSTKIHVKAGGKLAEATEHHHNDHHHDDHEHPHSHEHSHDQPHHDHERTHSHGRNWG